MKLFFSSRKNIQGRKQSYLSKENFVLNSVQVNGEKTGLKGCAERVAFLK